MSRKYYVFYASLVRAGLKWQRSSRGMSIIVSSRRPPYIRQGTPMGTRESGFTALDNIVHRCTSALNFNLRPWKFLDHGGSNC